jgi:hypothetical protein
MDLYTINSIILNACYLANLLISIQLWGVNINKRTSLPLYYIENIIFVLCFLAVLIIECNKFLFVYCKGKGKGKYRIQYVDWLKMELNYTCISLTLFLVTSIQLSMELYVYVYHSLNYSSTIGSYVLIQLILTYILFILSFVLFQSKIKNYLKEKQTNLPDSLGSPP